MTGGPEGQQQLHLPPAAAPWSHWQQAQGVGGSPGQYGQLVAGGKLSVMQGRVDVCARISSLVCSLVCAAEHHAL